MAATDDMALEDEVDAYILELLGGAPVAPCELHRPPGGEGPGESSAPPPDPPASAAEGNSSYERKFRDVHQLYPPASPGLGSEETGTFTVTLGDAAEAHAGMEIIRAPQSEQALRSDAVAGFTEAELALAALKFRQAGCEAEVIDIPFPPGCALPGEADWLARVDQRPCVLVARGAAALFATPGGDRGLQKLALQLKGIPYDTKAKMRGSVKNKLARHCVCVGDEASEPNYEEGRGRIVTFDGPAPRLSAIREKLPAFFGPKAEGLVAEINHYYNASKCGIGYHGDGERQLVIGVRVGRPMPLCFWWHRGAARLGERTRIDLYSGDLYAMSAKAVGRDWRKSVFPTVRHAAGAAKYID